MLLQLIISFLCYFLGSSAGNAPELRAVSRPADDNSSARNTTMFRVVGRPANHDDFPWMVIIYDVLKNNKNKFGCGGSIISDRWVLTAAHCLTNKETNKYCLVFGETSKRNADSDFYRGSGIMMITSMTRVYPSLKIQNGHRFPDDIGLLRTPKVIPFSNVIQPIALPHRYNQNEDTVFKNGIVIGWGKYSNKNVTASILNFGQISLMPVKECRRFWPVEVHYRTMCTIPFISEDSCEGDSGGPLVHLSEDDTFVQIGIVSSGDKLCPASKPGIYTRVSCYVDWIYSVIRS